MRTAERLAGWVRRSALITTIVGAVLIAASLITAGVMSGHFRIAPIAATTYATMGVASLCLGFLLRRYVQKLTLAITSGQLGPLAEAAAYETGYWRIVTPVVVLWAGMTALSVLMRFANVPLMVRAAAHERMRFGGEAMTLDALILYLAAVVFAGLAVLVVVRATTR